MRTTSEPPRPPPPPSLRPSGAPPPTDAAALLAELEHARRVLASKIADLRAFQTERETLLARIAERDATIKKLEASGGAEVPRLRTQVLDLESELSVAKREAQRVAQLDAEASALRAQARRLEALQSEQAARVAELEGALARESARASELEAALAAEHAKLLEREARVRKLEGEIEESLAWAPAPQDDLTRIKGIGPKFRDALAALGVRSYAQIAAWSDADVAEMAAKLRIQPARIARDGWVEAARALAAHGQRVG